MSLLNLPSFVHTKSLHKVFTRREIAVLHLSDHIIQFYPFVAISYILCGAKTYNSLVFLFAVFKFKTCSLYKVKLIQGNSSLSINRIEGVCEI